MIYSRKNFQVDNETDAIDSYFECVTECSLSDAGIDCTTRCLEIQFKSEYDYIE